jgi:eukaryotic-like serine/threonine-protein kinase
VSDVKVCPTCASEYPLSERFCPRDGTALRSSNAQADLIGSIVAERYHVMKKLGEGGMGTVYLAEHVKMGRKSALKVMNPGMNQDPDAVARFNREAANASRMSHPNICGIYDFGETPEGLIYLAMEFIEGQSLTDLIEKTGVLPPARAASILHQTADALQVAHDFGIVHRDLKPDNIMIAKGRDGADVVKVVDFGIAKASSSDAQKVTKTGLVVGTPEYMSPEQLAGDKLDGRSDLYSLALVGFNMLTGTLPFPSKSAQEAMIMRLTDHPKRLADMKPDVVWPESLQEVMDRGLARDPDERYRSAAEFGRDFFRVVSDMPATSIAEAGTMVIDVTAAAANVPKTRIASSAPAATPTPATAAKNRGMMFGAGGVVIAAVIIGVVMMKGSSGDVPTVPTSATDPAAAGQEIAPANDAATRPLSRQTDAAPPVSNPTTPAGRTAATNPPATPPTTSGTEPATISERDIATLDDLTDPTRLDDDRARRAIDLANGLLDRARGEQRVLVLYRRGTAYLGLEQITEACRDLGEARRLMDSASRLRMPVDEMFGAACRT